MKKLLTKLLALVVCAVSLFAFVGCNDEIENGSRIERMTITLDFYDASGAVVDSTDVEVKLYMNYAPETTARFISLAESGFYNGTCVSNVTSSYFEIGGYKYDAEGNLVKNPFTGDPIKGEFLKNGWSGNKLTVSAGALVMKHDVEGEGKYDSADGTVIICTGATGAYSNDKYCVFGMIESTDAADKDNSASDIPLDEKSSIDKCKEVLNYRSEDNADEQTVSTLYYEADGKFYTKWEDGEGTHYCEGATLNAAEELEGEALEAFEELLNDESHAFLTVPYVKIVINSIKKAA